MTRLPVLAATILSSTAAFAQESATAKMAGPDGSDLGTVTFNQSPSGVLHIIVEMSKLLPGTHGFHIHETGACDAAGGFESAGGHIAGGKEHGVLSPNGPHPGDFPNVHVAENGVLKVELFSTGLKLPEAGDNALLGGDGAAVVVHAEPDDYQSDPADHAGKRIACGIIEQPS